MTKSAETITELQRKWLKRDDSTAKRLVGTIVQLHDKNNPIIESILNDDVASFKRAYEKDKESLPLVFWFDIACICGAENTVFYLIHEKNFDVNESDDGIAYALSSGKFDFALKLAQLAKEKGKKNPGNIYLYNTCNFSDLKKIESMFIDNNHVR